MGMFLLRDLPRFETMQCQAARYPGVDPSACQVCLLTLRVASDMLEAIESRLAEHGLSQGRFTVLMLLNRDPEVAIAPSELAQRAGVTRATMTGLLDGLEREGLVQRWNCPEDRRMCRILLTRKARRKLDGMLPQHFERVAAMVGGLSKADRNKLVELLGKMAQGIPAMRE